MPKPYEEPWTRFMRQTKPDGDCWLFQGTLNHGGYGKFWYLERTVAAHKFAYEWAKGVVPDGLTIDHLCRVRRCVNPDHLEAVTMRENAHRAAVLKTHCPHGHEYIPENTYWVTAKGSTYRVCKACERAKYLRKKASRNVV